MIFLPFPTCDFIFTVFHSYSACSEIFPRWHSVAFVQRIYTLLKLKANPLVINCRAVCPKTKAGSCKENDTAELLSAVLRITVGGGFLCAVYVHTLQYTYNVHTVYVYCI